MLAINRTITVLIAYTNHALDHMVTSVLDAGITQKIVRLGTRSSDERISEYTLDKLERLATAPTLDRSIKRQYAQMKDLEEQMTKTMTSIRLPRLNWPKIEKYLHIHYPEHEDAFNMPPFWIAELAKFKWQEEDAEGEFQEVRHGKKGKKPDVDSSVSRTLYGIWREGFDLAFIQQRPSVPAQSTKSKGKGKGKQRADDAPPEGPQSFLTDPPAFFASLGFAGMPPVPAKNRQLGDLLTFPNVWLMSAPERATLAEDWERKIRSLAYSSNLDQYKSLKKRYEDACKAYDEMRDEVLN